MGNFSKYVLNLEIKLGQDITWKQVSSFQVGPRVKNKREGLEEEVIQCFSKLNLFKNHPGNLKMLIMIL